MQWKTTTQILEELQLTSSDLAWGQFCDHFQPIVVGFGRKLGLSAADAQDAAQETMISFLSTLRQGQYDRTKGQLSSWLLGIAKKVILNLRRRAARHAIHTRATDKRYWDSLPEESTLESVWESQWQRVILTRCLDQVRNEFEPEVDRAFELYAMQDRPVDQVAEELGASRNAIYIAKSRILARLRQLRLEVEEKEGGSLNELSRHGND